MIEIRVEGRAERGAVKWVCVPEEICLGAAGSSGMEKIRVSLPAAWDGMTVRMTFLPYRRPAVAVLVRDGDEVEVTGNMTCGRGGTGEIVFDAATDGKATYTAAGARYTVYSHAAAGGEDPGYTPDEWQQFVARVEDAARSTEEALNEAKGLDISKDIQAAVEAAAELHVKLDEADGLAEAAADAADRAEAAAEVAENAAAGSMPDGSITTEKLAPDAEAPFAGNGVHQLTHQKVGTMHQLSGLGGRTGMISVVFKASAAFAEGDIFVVDGVTYAARMPDGEAVADNAFTAGAAVGAVLDTAGKTVNFKLGGGVRLPALTKPAGAAQIFSGYEAINGAGEVMTGTAVQYFVQSGSKTVTEDDVEEGTYTKFTVTATGSVIDLASAWIYPKGASRTRLYVALIVDGTVVKEDVGDYHMNSISLSGRKISFSIADDEVLDYGDYIIHWKVVSH